MVKLVPGTWVVIADGEKALFTENTASGWEPKLKVLSVEQQDPEAVQPRPTDRPGRRADGGRTRSRPLKKTLGAPMPARCSRRTWPIC